MSIKGTRLQKAVGKLISDSGLDQVLSVSGHPVWSFLLIKDHEYFDASTIKTFFMQEMMDNGILCLGSHLLTYAHSNEDIDLMIRSYDSFIRKLKEGLEHRSLVGMLRCEPLRPLFRVRKGT